MAISTDIIDQQKNIVSRISDEAFGEGDLSVVEEVFAAEYVQHGPFQEDVHGIDGMKESVRVMRDAFPDLATEDHVVVGEGEYVLLHQTISGTHEGALMGIEPTGNVVSVSSMVLHRFEDGKVAEAWVIGDTMGLLHQLGVPELPGQ